MKQFFWRLSAVITLLILVGAGCEREGSIDTGSCKININEQRNDISTLLHTYTCIYDTKCCRLETTNGVCITSYCYDLPEKSSLKTNSYQKKI